jgi:glycosyltransferase involved in cell wall biosynthesis
LRRSLSESAQQRARNFTWEQAADKTLKVYDRLRSG